MKSVSGVLFDLGGTLFEHLESTTSDSNLLRAVGRLNQQLQDAGFPTIMPARFVHRYRQLRFDEELRRLAQPFFLHQELVRCAFEHAVEQVNGSAVPAAIVRGAALEFCTLQRESVIAQLRPQRDMRPTLQEIQRLGVGQGVVSNIDEDYLQPLIRKHQLANHLLFWLSSEVAGSCKPHQSIFQQALTRLAVADPSTVLFVGDSHPHDVAGANEAGMKSVWLAPAGSQTPVGAEAADYQISSLSQLIGIITA